jgi:HD-GYP domain-containing protein (c-di-GMP phosphodiesterase class II)
MMQESKDQEQQLAALEAEIAGLRRELDGARSEAAAKQALVSELARIGTALSAEKDRERLLEMISELARRFTNADGCTLYIKDEREEVLRFTIVANQSLNVFMGGQGSKISWPPVPLKDKDGQPNHRNVSAQCALTGEIIKISDVYSACYDFQGTREFDAKTGYRSKSMLLIPMRDNENEIIGVVQLLNAMDRQTNEVVDFDDEEIEIVASLASQAAIAITNMHLIDGLEELLQATVRMVATAIDEKSPYTAGHVQRVAALTEAVIHEINAVSDGPYAGVSFTPDQIKEVRMAAWLHDVGKIVTPEHIVDKATKLECRYDRIGLVEHRIEILKQEARLRQGGQGDATGASAEEELRHLEESLAFLIGINQGGEFMSDAHIARVRELAALRYQCHGGQHPLLSDDEVENLTIRKGTLTDREREVINNHVAVGIKMLNSLRFPRKLRNVAPYATMHHEKLDGSGYPLGLTAEQIPLGARVISVADIFEALSASDRPYKKANSVADVMRIMGFMVKDGHVDGDICDLMAESGLVARYAREHLALSQWGDFEWRGKRYSV